MPFQKYQGSAIVVRFHLFWEQFFLWKNFLRSGTIWLVTFFPCFNQEDNTRWVVFDNSLVFLKSFLIFEKFSIILFKKYNYFLWVCLSFWPFWAFFGLKKNQIRIDTKKEVNNLSTTLYSQFKRNVIFQIHRHKRVANFSRFWIHFTKSQKLKTKVFFYRKSSLWEC